MTKHDPRLDDTGVSPVISTILMVAVTVILAAVIGTLALSFIEKAQQPPQGSFDGEQVEKHLIASLGNEADFWAIKITYQAGESIKKRNLKVRVNGQKAYGVELKQKKPGYNNCNFPCHRAINLWSGKGSIKAGQSILVVHEDSSAVEAGNTYSITPDGEDDPDNAELYSTQGGPRIDLKDGDTVQVVWEPPFGGESALLFQQEVESRQ